MNSEPIHSEQSNAEWFLPKKRKRFYSFFSFPFNSNYIFRLTEEERLARVKAKEDARAAREAERKAKEEAKKAAKELKQKAREAKKAELAAKKPGKRGRRKKSASTEATSSTEVTSFSSIEQKEKPRKKRKGSLLEIDKCHVCGQRKETGAKQGLEHLTCSSCSSSYCGTCYLKYFPRHRLIRDCPICAGNCDCIQCHQEFNTFEWHVRCVLKQYDAIIFQQEMDSIQLNQDTSIQESVDQRSLKDRPTIQTQVLMVTRDLLVNLLSNAATNNRVVIPEPENPYNSLFDSSNDSDGTYNGRKRASDRDYKKKVTQVDSSCHICRTRHEGKRVEVLFIFILFVYYSQLDQLWCS